MNGHNEREIVEWGYWTAKFLFDVSEKIHKGVKPEGCIFGNFLKDNGFGENTTFVLDNQATILMTAYILLVYPRELLNQFDYNTLPDDLQHPFTFAIPASPAILDNEAFIKKMRNAIAHANIALALGENAAFQLWNERNNNRDFDVTISKKNFVGFLGQLGKSFVEYIRNHPAEV